MADVCAAVANWQHGAPVTTHTKLKELQTQEFTWSIEGLSVERLKAVPPGSALAGPTLMIDGIEMFASLFCNGDGAVAETKDHACLVRLRGDMARGRAWRGYPRHAPRWECSGGRQMSPTRRGARRASLARAALPCIPLASGGATGRSGRASALHGAAPTHGAC